MDTNMEDVGRIPADVSSLPTLEPATIPTLDGWIESLMNCKQLAEVDVQRLCEKVRKCPLVVQTMESSQRK
jgi:serine/threonine-protein phosphatase 2A catalytic subunit